MNWNPNFVSFIFFVRLKCKKCCIYGFNLILGNKFNKFKVQYMVIFFYCKIHSFQKKETSQGDFSSGCGAQLA